MIPLVGILKRLTDFSNLGVLYAELAPEGIYDFGSPNENRTTFVVEREFESRHPFG